jgi:pimeloyl-ACP methyl ester carboxylesterase
MSDKKGLLNYRVVGDGYPVVFLHGFLESNTMWDELALSLTLKYKCIFIELPGHGKSEPLTEIPSIIAFAKRVSKTIAEVTDQPFSLVGHSLGGYVALKVVELLKTFDERLILLNSHPWEDSISKKEERNRVIEVVNKNKALFIQTAIPNLYRSPEQHSSKITTLVYEAMKMESTSIIDTLVAMRDRSDKTQVMSGLKERCLVIQGKHDHLIDSDKMEKSTIDYSNRFQIILNAGHMAHQESKEEVIKGIGAFI